VKNVAAYVTKYMTKNEDDLNIVGENWRASKELTDIKGARIDINEGILKEIERLQNKPESRRIDKEYFSGIFFNNKFLTRKEFPLLTDLFDKYIVEIFGYKEQIIFNSD
jgi:hypothetical protein